MKKSKLPKDWIIVNSKTHPDKIYYFNVKTNRSTWLQPTLDLNDEASSCSVAKHRCSTDERISRASTPECNSTKSQIEENKNHQKKSSRNKRLSQIAEKMEKEIDTPQMKALREKMLQRRLQKSAPKRAKKAATLLSETLDLKTTESKTVSLPKILKNSLKSAKQDTSTTSSLSQNDNKTTFTPQMRILYEKIQRRSSGTSSSDEKTEIERQNKRQKLEINQTLVKEQEEQPKNIPKVDNINQNKNNVKKLRNPQLKTNLAKERMQKLRKSLLFDKEKIEEIGSITTEKASKKLNKSLPASYHSENLEFGSIGKNVEVRLKRLHHKITKNAIYEKNVTPNNKLQTQQDKKLSFNIMTKEKLIEQANQEVYEEMDWEPMRDEEITTEIEVVRTQLDNKEATTITNYLPENAVQLTRQPNTQENNILHIVIDTNVFLTNLKIVEEARDATFKTYPRPYIVIPWTVIRELDYLKNDKSRSETLCINARKAISFLNEHFAAKHPRVIGQTREQAIKNKEDFSLECPDDEILQCCLQIRELRENVVLLSYDKNLCVKAMIYDIVALGRNDPLEKIDYLNENDRTFNILTSDSAERSLLDEELHLSDDIFEDLKAAMKDFLSAIIIKRMSDIYGSDWEMYVIIKPPWTIVTVLKCAIKHWIAAISESFQRRSEYILKELLQEFQHLPPGGRKLQNVEHILEKCSNLIQTVNTDKHYEIMTQLFNIITQLKTKCLKYIADIDEKKLHDKIGIAETDQEREQRAEKALECFKQIYNYARDFCGLATSIIGMAFPINFNPMNPPLLEATVKRLQAEITDKVIDITQNLNKLLIQYENSSVKYQTLITLQQCLNTFFSHIEKITFEIEPIDIYYCMKLQEDTLKMGLRQLQELSTYYCRICTHI